MRHVRLAVLLGLAVVIGCHHAPPAPAPAPAPIEDLAARARADSIRMAEQARADAMARADAERQARAEADRLARLRAALRDTLARPTHFAFDRADIEPADQASLNRKLAILQANPGLMVQIAGHADERGSDEYNLALGARRAAAARTYLVGHGVAPERLQVVSYGEERPVASQHDEMGWAMNRRDEYAPLTMADSLLPPGASR